MCSDHFVESDFKTEVRLGFEALRGACHLLPDAVPTRNLPESVSAESTESRAPQTESEEVMAVPCGSSTCSTAQQQEEGVEQGPSIHEGNEGLLEENRYARTKNVQNFLNPLFARFSPFNFIILLKSFARLPINLLKLLEPSYHVYFFG